MSPKWRPKQVQNGFVQIWAEQGTLGIIIFLALLAMVFKELFVSMRRHPTSEEHLMLVGLLSCYFGLIGMMMFIPLTQQESTWIIFALSIAAARLLAEKRSEEKKALAAESVPPELVSAEPDGM